MKQAGGGEEPWGFAFVEVMERCYFHRDLVPLHGDMLVWRSLGGGVWPLQAKEWGDPWGLE